MRFKTMRFLKQSKKLIIILFQKKETTIIFPTKHME